MSQTASLIAVAPSPRNQIGQVMGRKGQDTRARLIGAVVRLIADRPLRELKVSDIAREAGVGASSFYVYFPDVSAAVLAALAQHSQATPELMEIVDREWTPSNAIEFARGFVMAFRAFWKDNFALLRARNLAYDEGDERFNAQRCQDIEPILVSLAAKVEVSQRAGRLPPGVPPRRIAALLLGALERMAAGNRLDEETIEAAAFVMVASLGLHEAS